MTLTTPFFHVRWLLRARHTIQVHPWQHATVYALLCDAARGEVNEAPMQIPEGLLLEAPETGRTLIEAGEHFAFGATVHEADVEQATRRLHRLSRGLVRLGQARPAKPVALGGNFDLLEVRDRVANVALEPGQAFRPVSPDVIQREFEALAPMLGRPITLRFLTPLRLELPAREGADGHRFADERTVIVGQLLRAVQKRLQAIGVVSANAPEPPFDDAVIELVDNRLVWLDLGYGSPQQRKTLGGALGRVCVKVHDPTPLAALIWGQRTHVGKNLHFGFGQYRIEELGADPAACERSLSVLRQAFKPSRILSVAEEYELDPAALLTSAEQILAGSYTPAKPHAVTLAKADGGERTLQIPGRLDRALQRLILNRIGPAFDRLFESSSFAWRKGLNREAAARRIERLANDGWAFAVKADFDRYFETIPHPLLRDRLDVWGGDDRLVEALLKFIPAGVGVPTGSPLSPLLGNLFLDRFDELVEREGDRLVRYGDDLLILMRTRERADAVHQRAKDMAAELQLRLNADSEVLDLREPFEFLGFEFRSDERWQYAGPSGPRRLAARRTGGHRPG